MVPVEWGETREPGAIGAAEEAETGFGGELRWRVSIGPSERKSLWGEALQTEGAGVRDGLRGGAGTDPLYPSAP